MFLTIAHAATLYYHVQVIRSMVETDYSDITDIMVLNFRDNRTKYFTMWCFAIQTLMFLLCCLHDLTRVLKESHPVRRAVCWVRDLLFTSLAAPLAVNVFLLFWVLFTLDRNLVMPPELDTVIPTWMNHALHSNILVLVVVELLAERHQLPGLKPCVLLNVVVSIVYLYVFIDVYRTKGLWLYPLFDLLSWPQRMLFFVAVVGSSFGQMLVARAAVRAVWGSEADQGSRRLHAKKHKD